jgi:hypothetical protein
MVPDDLVIPIIISIVLTIPYCYVIARVVCYGYFQAKLRYHRHILTTSITKEEQEW